MAPPVGAIEAPIEVKCQAKRQQTANKDDARSQQPYRSLLLSIVRWWLSIADRAAELANSRI
jgi:hypothetical protein